MKKLLFSTLAGGSAGLALMLSACATMPAAGPSSRNIDKVAAGRSPADANIKVVDVSEAVTRSILANRRADSFSQAFGDGQPIGSVIGKGDVLDIAIWEAPPAALFSTAGGDGRLASSEGDARLALSGATTARGTTLPEQMVDSDGRIDIPFVGRVQAAGRTPQEIAREIDTRLAGKAHLPQTIVRLAHNSAAAVTVVGDVAQSSRVALTARGERILDVLASAGGVKQPVGKTAVQITRGSKIDSMPLNDVIHDPRENIRLQPDDVMTLLFQPYSFTALGATGKNEEIPFEATGLTLAQALGRVAGMQDTRANVKGVFVFRLEDPNALDPSLRATARVTPNGKVPVIYRIDMRDPANLFVAQSFPIQDKDVLYVSNAPLADFQKFVNVIYSMLLPVATTATVAF